MGKNAFGEPWDVCSGKASCAEIGIDGDSRQIWTWSAVSESRVVPCLKGSFAPIKRPRRDPRPPRRVPTASAHCAIDWAVRRAALLACFGACYKLCGAGTAWTAGRVRGGARACAAHARAHDLVRVRAISI